MPTSEPVTVAARGDEWAVEHESLPREETYDRFAAAAEVADDLASEYSTTVEFTHPRNPNLRRLHP